MIDIATEGLSARIDPLGAELHVLKDGQGRDLLWDGDPAVWSGRAPILFPIVGTLAGGQYRLDGMTYALGRHGFARLRMFEVLRAEASSAVFRLRADAATRAVYPFDFALEIAFVLHGATLTMAATIRNLGETPMPASFGFHPAFRRPLPYGRARADHAITFSRPEPAPIRRIYADGLLKPDGEPTPVVGDWLLLRDELFVDDALIFDPLESRSLRYGAPDGPSLTIAFPDTPYLGVWTKPGADFIAVEPWHGFSDPEGFAGDFRDKPGIFTLAPGQDRGFSMSVTLNA